MEPASATRLSSASALASLPASAIAASLAPALLGELDAWNATASTKVRAITPYRWTKNDDGTGRDFAIGARTTLLLDVKKSFEKKVA